MRVKLNDKILILNFISLILVLVVHFWSDSILRMILGVPFVLFLPGYALILALWPARGGISVVERIALSLGLSVALVALIGLAVNYTPWGLQQEPILWSLVIFILIMSIIAWFRYRRLHLDDYFTIPVPDIFKGFGKTPGEKILTLIMVIVALGAIVMISFAVGVPKPGERFTEFYILGRNGAADNYPSTFAVNNQLSVVRVQYGNNPVAVNEQYGQVTLGIINQEQQKASYSVTIQIDGEPVSIIFQGNTTNRLDGVMLEQGEKWEQLVGFAPRHTGDNQKVEFFLYKDGASDPENTLQLWINVKEG